MKLDPFLTLYTKIVSTWMKDHAKIINLLEEKIGGDLHDIGFSNNFLDMIIKTTENKKK